MSSALDKFVLFYEEHQPKAKKGQRLILDARGHYRSISRSVITANEYRQKLLKQYNRLVHWETLNGNTHLVFGRRRPPGEPPSLKEYLLARKEAKTRRERRQRKLTRLLYKEKAKVFLSQMPQRTKAALR